MQRAPITAVLAVVFYVGLLFWAVAWRGADGDAAEVSDAPPQTPALAPVAAAALPQTSALAAQAEPQPGSLAPAEIAAGQRDDGSWEIAGQIGDEGLATALSEAFAAAGTEVSGEIVASPEVAAAPWGRALADWVPTHAAALGGGSDLGVIDGQVLIAGSVATAEERDALLADARAHFADAGLEVVGEIDVAGPAPPAEFVLVAGDNGGYQIAGKFATADAGLKTRIIELIGEITGGDAAVEDNLSVGGEAARAPWGAALLQVLPALLVEVDGPQVMAGAGTFLMAGTVTGGENTRVAIAQTVEQSFAGTPVSIDDRLEVAAAAEPASLSISRDKEGKITVAGQLPKGAPMDAFLAKARAAAGDTPPAELIGSSADTGPAPWLDAMGDLVNPFAASARWGALSVHGDQVAIEAEVTDAETADVLTALVTGAFPDPDYKRVIAVSVAAPTGPSDEDIAALEALAGSAVVYFGSNSAELTPEGRALAAELAAAMTKVPGSGIALLGHADPYGRKDYNRELSGRRCAAVRAVLEEGGIEPLLIETEIVGESGGRGSGKRYESDRRVEFELR